MAVYQYTGLDVAGKSVRGSVKAGSERAALDRLTADSIIPVEIKRGKEAAEGGPGIRELLTGAGRVPAALRTVFVRELATFIHADIPLLDALNVMRQQQEHLVFKKIQDQLHDDIQGGASFSEALRQHPRAFPPLLVSMVRVGETGGILGKVLDQMADWMEAEEEVKSEVRGAMAYPAMVLFMAMVTVGIITTFVMPRILPIFEGMGGELPFLTKALIFMTAVVKGYWWLLIAIVLGAIAGLIQMRRSEGGRKILDRVALHAPIFGALVRMSAISRFTRSTAALLSSGVPLLEALQVVRGLVGNSVMVAMVDNTIAGVTRGDSLARKLSESEYFPASMVHLLGVGERTGRLDDMFNRVADTFEKQTRQHIKVIVDLLTPLMIVFLAIGVAFIALAILLPIFKMNQNIG